MDFNVIHAFWDEDLIQELKPYLDENNVLLERFWDDAFDKEHPLFYLLEKLLKGLEIDLPNNVSYLDKDGHKREQARVKWWNLLENDLQKIVLGDQEVLSQVQGHYLSQNLEINLGHKVIFMGHYWMTGVPQLLSGNVVCTDYSAVKANGKLVGYLYQSGQLINSDNFVFVQKLLAVELKELAMNNLIKAMLVDGFVQEGDIFMKVSEKDNGTYSFKSESLGQFDPINQKSITGLFMATSKSGAFYSLSIEAGLNDDLKLYLTLHE